VGHHQLVLVILYLSFLVGVKAGTSLTRREDFDFISVGCPILAGLVFARVGLSFPFILLLLFLASSQTHHSGRVARIKTLELQMAQPYTHEDFSSAEKMRIHFGGIR
jgi:hypothetical protein